MTTEIRVPTLGESVTEATVAKWFKQVGDAVAQDEPLLELETDKVALEVTAPSAGALLEIRVQAGETVEVNALLGVIDEAAKGATAAPKAAAAAAPAAAPAAPAAEDGPIMPAAAKMIREFDLDARAITGTGKGGRITKEDVVAYMDNRKPGAAAPVVVSERQVERVPMTRLRKRIAQRLKEAQNTAAMLTTYNEVDMTAVMGLRDLYKDMFERKHGVKMGFMSFFAKACSHALMEMPDVNASIDGEDIVYHRYTDIGIATSTPAGLVVPVVRGVEGKGFADIEKAIAALAVKAREGKLALDDLQGGTFSITNGGVFGSLMSSPILNPPQSAILGMHAIKKRPVVVNDQIVIRPMMYLALSYDHRLVDGAGAVTFLVRVKEALEDPQRLLLDL
ncbi:2-oxoglutarate dehydrogenase complex dihydrolipoyllysine-residue succinyltransferase [Govanella unica]|uniref:Dihydrolipoyllysine-residue succinyltransferase component of 2-oxoglutarate dehydrogenase complex n=1 Tax=Govanella unica TaxID=2975056 RepID=A0A9X3TW10_9PROT|nr:2-oxoglutarate dehydrogenase complex dihydrolipoyllysine-residue succinyltransferase [Govania unica]MDA5192745.1 2-oxoglutarate dehydrogenase complex dihydrolipoyllysine-residue succinyltransferase [Govania unica]